MTENSPVELRSLKTDIFALFFLSKLCDTIALHNNIYIYIKTYKLEYTISTASFDKAQNNLCLIW